LVWGWGFREGEDDIRYQISDIRYLNGVHDLPCDVVVLTTFSSIGIFDCTATITPTSSPSQCHAGPAIHPGLNPQEPSWSCRTCI
jgi:hypothetical protein